MQEPTDAAVPVVEEQKEQEVTVTTTTEVIQEAQVEQQVEQQQEESITTAAIEEPVVAEAVQQVEEPVVASDAIVEEDIEMEEDDTKQDEADVESETAVEEVKDEHQPEQQQQTEEITAEPATPLEDTNKEGGCSHINKVSGVANEIKRTIYKVGNPSLCDICLARTASYLNMSDTCHNEACRSCLDSPADDEEHFPIQLELSTGDLYCFECKDSDNNPHKLGHDEEEEDSEKVKSIVEYIKAPESDEDLDKRRKAEHQLYVQELRREDMSLKHYLMEKQWGRTWMLFRTREGSPLPGKITNNKLARMNGTLDPNIRLPMDKFRPSPETHGDIVSERLWNYLVKAYGVQGRAYSEDDIIAPEYARLRVYVDDFKKSIHLYP